MRQNPRNGIICLGHSNGQCSLSPPSVAHPRFVEGNVTMWSPNMPTPLVKMLAHKGAAGCLRFLFVAHMFPCGLCGCGSAPIMSLEIDLPGRHMVTAGLDGERA
jgi:hypothetical protein